MTQFIITLSDALTPAKQSLIGRKAASLSQLLVAGFPVLPGLCLTTKAFDSALAPSQVAVRQALAMVGDGSPERVESVADELAPLLRSLSVPQAALMALEEAQAADERFQGQLAARSSATAEDLTEASLAGQYRSTLGIRGQAALEEAILRCWRSFFSPAALAARARANIIDRTDSMAILIQPLVAAECAGVCLTVDPVTQDEHLLVVNATWGLGSGVASGQTASDTYWLKRPALRLFDKQVLPQKKALVIGAEGSMLTQPLPPEKQRAAVLSENWLSRVAQLALAAEHHFQSPQAIEWAVADGELWLLQSRPLAELPPALRESKPFPVTWSSPEQHRHLWRLYGGEPAVRLPLEQDDIQLRESIRTLTCRFIGAERNGQVAFFNGRAYFTSLPLDWPTEQIEARRRLHRQWREWLYETDRSDWDYWAPEIVAAVSDLQRFDGQQASGPTLAAHLEKAMAIRRRHAMLHPQIWFRPSQAYLDAFAAVSGWSETAAETAAYQLLTADDNVLTHLNDELYELARLARSDPALATYVSQAAAAPETALDIRPTPESKLVRQFRQRFHHFMDRYGGRNGSGYGSEAEITTPTWREQPQQVFQLIAAYLPDSVEAPRRLRQRVRARQRKQLDALCQASADPQAAAELRRRWQYAMRALAGLEDHNHYIDQLSLSELRRAAQLAGQQLAERDLLAAAADVFWLTFAEILSALRQPVLSRPFHDRIAARRRQNRNWARLSPAPVIGQPDPTLPPRPRLVDDVSPPRAAPPGQLRGLGASRGRRRGPARIMTDINAATRLQPGDILVAPNVGPRWTPFFPVLGGLVLDGGSLGQHAAACAREYGLPAVIATGDATRRLTEGSQIVVDGTAGYVLTEF
ncbi:MAG: PEP/pyruvate-binding domain-containing protein [Candidatus Promineifilaceae bacterium]|nr:PEP/pyruvate-binding domain-containing protein [Candidatus Promineifilaceae bacterium]